jgi:prepilin-type N-terminal cleavage/methylation domain-containing protein
MTTVRPTPAQPRQSGFTLLEILVALAVLGLLMASLVQGLRAGISAWTTQSERLARNADVDAADRTLRGLLARLDPGGVSGRPSLFKGTEHSLTFTTSVSDPAGAILSQVVDVLLAVDESHRLQMVLLPHYRDLAAVPAAPGHVLLLRDVDRLELGYWQDAKTGWQTEWRGVTVPKLIRIRAVSTPRTGRTMPDIIVAPMRARWQV